MPPNPNPNPNPMPTHNRPPFWFRNRPYYRYFQYYITYPNQCGVINVQTRLALCVPDGQYRFTNLNGTVNIYTIKDERLISVVTNYGTYGNYPYYNTFGSSNVIIRG